MSLIEAATRLCGPDIRWWVFPPQMVQLRKTHQGYTCSFRLQLIPDGVKLATKNSYHRTHLGPWLAMEWFNIYCEYTIYGDRQQKLYNLGSKWICWNIG